MAISKKPLNLPFLAFITIFLLLASRVYSSDTTSFTFDGFDQNDPDLIYQGDAHVSQNDLQLTKTDSNDAPQKNTVGRALYSAQVHLYEKSTGRLSSFETTFTFVLRSPLSNPADGFAFFIAPSDSVIPPNSGGGMLGLYNSNTKLNPTKNQAVAVEFDTFYAQDSNTWDPNYMHIGIDVNTIKSSATVKWDRREGAVGTARVNYNAATRNLSVVSSYPGSQVYAVSYIVDLSNANLPEYVRVGFTAASGQQVQVHNIRSWYFTSVLQFTRAKKDDLLIKSVV